MALASDGKLTGIDFMGHDGPLLELRLDGAGQLADAKVLVGIGNSESLDRAAASAALQLSQRSDTWVAGSFNLDRHAVQFDLPVHVGEHFSHVVGSALPADGGAPGAAFGAMIRAVHAGDIAALIAAAVPERAQRLRAAQ